MKFLGFLAATTMTGLCLATAGAGPEYLLTIENASSVSYNVEIHDQSRTHGALITPGRSVSWTVGTQTPKVVVTGNGCSASATPSIKTYVTLEVKAGCKIVTKAAGVSGF